MYKPYLLSVKISESCILSIRFYAGSKFFVINTIPPLKDKISGISILKRAWRVIYDEWFWIFGYRR